jgi:hypothetical protein
VQYQVVLTNGNFVIPEFVAIMAKIEDTTACGSPCSINDFVYWFVFFDQTSVDDAFVPGLGGTMKDSILHQSIKTASLFPTCIHRVRQIWTEPAEKGWQINWKFVITRNEGNFLGGSPLTKVPFQIDLSLKKPVDHK